MSKVFFIFICYFYNSGLLANEPSQNCKDWFKNGKISIESKDCNLRCEVLRVDMGTFSCSSQCKSLCKKNSN